MNPGSLHSSSMDALPKTHELTKEEETFIASLDPKDQELHKLAVEWLQTSYRPEWSHIWKKKGTTKTA